jgi:Na+/H+ antiporter NhaD/arsenite permease-like protein
LIDPTVTSQVHQLIQAHAANTAGFIGSQPDEIRQTLAVLQKYHGLALAAGTVGRDQIEIAFLIGHAKFNAYIAAISVGSVFFGANTYIGNSPNLMVKSIAEGRRAPTPSFLGYVIGYALPFMAPLLLLVWWVFFR